MPLTGTPRFIKQSMIAVALAISATTANAVELSDKDVKAGIDRTLNKVDSLRAKGATARQIANVLYEDDLMVIVEGEKAMYSGIRTVMPLLAEHLKHTMDCRLKALEPIRHSGKLAVAFVSESCPASADADAGPLRMVYVFRNGAKGWRVTMESAAVGEF